MRKYRRNLAVYIYCLCLLMVNSEEQDVIKSTRVDEYIIVTPKGKNKDLSPLMDSLAQRKIIVKQQILTFSRAYVVVQATREELDYLSGTRLIDLIAENQVVHAMVPYSMSPVSPFPPFRNKTKPRFDATKPRVNSGERVKDCHREVVGTLGGWGLVRTSYHEIPRYDMLPYNYAHEGSGVDIYVLDTGVDIHHEAFEGRASYGMVSRFLNTTEIDLNGHGTNVAGIAAGNVYGVAKNSSVISCKVLGNDGQGSVSAVIEGVAWVIKRVRASSGRTPLARAVINLSLESAGVNPAERAAIQEAVDSGITVIAAAGNDGQDACSYSPAAFSNIVITVAASTREDELADFSNWGTCIDLFAPGVDIVGPWSQYSEFCDTPLQMYEGCYARISGTSQAAPFVTGTVAKFLSSLSNRQLNEFHVSTAMAAILASATEGVLKLNSTMQAKSDTPNKLVFCNCEEELFDWPDITDGTFGGVDSCHCVTDILSIHLLLLSLYMIMYA